ncbi:hypothetical protein C8Q76DRAFT_628908 [Earliella scabrosa]|nr:hypothetical protein C8Q76DRAFT_628908 [Earliella scabrosa]
MLSGRIGSHSDSLLKLCRSRTPRVRSHGHRPYSSKVRALPFVITREHAVRELSWFTSGFTSHKLLGTVLRHFFPTLNVDALRPTRIQAVYLPTWVVDSQVQAAVWLKKQESDAEFSKIFVAGHQLVSLNMLTGFVYEPLSTFNLLLGRDIRESSTVPWTEQLRKHDGDDVLCLPFSLSPFKLPEAARSLSLSGATVSHSFRFDPSSIHTTMLAAYPILMPIYIAQFQVDDIVDGAVVPRQVTSVIEAGRQKGRVFLEAITPLKLLYNVAGLDSPDIIVRGDHAPQTRSFVKLRPVLCGQATDDHRRQLRRWMDHALSTLDFLKQYRNQYFGKTEQEAAQEVNWDDIRIRPLTHEEQVANVQWLTIGEDLYLLRVMQRVYEKDRGVCDIPPSSTGQDGDPAANASNEDFEKLVKQIEALEKMREEKKPAWFAQYELEQRLVAEHPSATADAARTPPE